MSFKWIIKQNGENIASLFLVDTNRVIGPRETRDYWGENFEVAKSEAIKALTEIQKAPLKIHNERR